MVVDDVDTSCSPSRWNHHVRIKENVCCVECLKKHKTYFCRFSSDVSSSGRQPETEEHSYYLHLF